MAAAALPPIGARLVFAGVDQFLAGLASVGTALGDFGGAGGQLGNLQDGLHGATAGFRTFNTAVAEVGTSIGVVTGTVSTLTAPFRAVGSAVSSAAGEIVEGGRKIVGAIGDIAVATGDLSEKGLIGLTAIGGAITTLAVTAVTESARYERGMKNIEAVSQTTGPALDAIDIAIRRVGTSFPASIGNIQQAALELAKAGVPIDAVRTKILDLTVAIEQLSGGELSSAGAAEAIGASMKLFERSFTDAGATAEQQGTRISSSIVAIANKTRASIPEVISAITKLGPNLAVLGGTVEQTSALAGVVLAQGPRGQEAGTALSNLFQRLENPSREAAQILKKRPELNLFTAEGLPRPAIDVIKSFQDTYGAVLRTNTAIDGLTPAMATAELAEIAQTRTLRTLNLILGLGTEGYDEFLDAIANTDVLAQAAVQNEALIRQLEILRNNAVLAGVAFGRDFVSGLGGAVRGLNELLRDGERAQAIAGVLGKATAAVLSGQGQDQARAAVSDSPFGEEGVQTFDAFNSASEMIRGNIVTLTRDAAQLGKTLGLISFPEGLSGVVEATGNAIGGLVSVADEIVRKFNEITPGILADLQKITGAATFQELIQHAQDFGREIASVFTSDNGEQSFERARDAIVSFLATARQEIGPTIIEIAKLARALEDNLPEFEKLADTAVRVGGIVVRAVATITTAFADAAGGVIAITSNLADLAGRYGQGLMIPIRIAFTTPGTEALGTPEKAIRDFLDQPAPSAPDFSIPSISIPTGRQRGRPYIFEDAVAGIQNFLDQPSPFAQGELPINPGVAAAADARERVKVDAQQAFRPTQTVEMTTEDVERINEVNAALEKETATAKAAAAAQAELEKKLHDSHGAYNTSIDDAKEAAAAQKALDGAAKSLGSAMRTLDKDIADAGGSFDKTAAGARGRWLDSMDQIAESTDDAFTRIQRTATEGRAKALEGFNLQVERGGGFFANLGEDGQAEIDLERGAVRGFNTVFKEGQEERKREFSQGLEDRVNSRHQFQEEETNAISRYNENLTRLEQQAQENVTRARGQGIEDRETLRTREQEQELLGFTRGQERSLTAFGRGQETTAQARQRSREDARASEDLATNLSKATTPEQRTSLLSSFTEERTRTARSRQDQNSDLQFSQQQQDQLTAYRQSQEDALTKQRQKLEDTNIQHRRELEVSDVQFRRELEVDLLRFRRDLEDRETGRRRVNAALEIAQRRREELEVLGFDRTQAQQQQLFTLMTTTLPDLNRQLAQINQQEVDQVQNTADTAARGYLRAGLTYRREIQAAGVTEEETRRRLLERFNNEAQNLIERVPESRRGDIQALVAGQRGVLQADLILAQARANGKASGATSELDEVTQRVLAGLALASPNVSSIASIFGAQGASVTTPLIATPQVDRLTTAIEKLTEKIDKVKPGVNINTVEQTIEQPTTPQGALVQIGTIGVVT